MERSDDLSNENIELGLLLAKDPTIQKVISKNGITFKR